jgi:hypothetical protein
MLLRLHNRKLQVQAAQQAIHNRDLLGYYSTLDYLFAIIIKQINS